MLSGRIVILTPSYAFIDPDDGRRWVFFHRNSLLGGALCWNLLRSGDRVTYELATAGRRRAVNVLRQPITQAERKERAS